jgi:hypothetical protein
METTSARPVVVGPGGSGVVAHVGLHALCAFADRLGLGDELSSAIPRPRERAPLHDHGKVLIHAMAMLAGGGEACSEIEFLRSEQSLFGNVASDSTLWRTFHAITLATRDEVKRAIANVRAEVWHRSAATTGEVSDSVCRTDLAVALNRIAESGGIDLHAEPRPLGRAAAAMGGAGCISSDVLRRPIVHEGSAVEGGH